MATMSSLSGLSRLHPHLTGQDQVLHAPMSWTLLGQLRACILLYTFRTSIHCSNLRQKETLNQNQDKASEAGVYCKLACRLHSFDPNNKTIYQLKREQQEDEYNCCRQGEVLVSLL